MCNIQLPGVRGRPLSLSGLIHTAAGPVLKEQKQKQKSDEVRIGFVPDRLPGAKIRSDA